MRLRIEHYVFEKKMATPDIAYQLLTYEVPPR
jgi:hypothetical protein